MDDRSLTQGYVQRFAKSEGVLYVGKAQEKSLGFEFVEEFSSPVWTELGCYRPASEAKP